ncbi:MAG: hypothetical protein JSU73_13175 [candidate division WOR-3 bacterium]|nr:MAG: hypothetical protein JSU73_13175 [candidate division WOR-3 bacterium]
MERLERRRRSPNVLGYLPWMLFALLLLVIVVAVFSNWGGLSGYWQRLVSPDSIPGLGQ